ncbi:hypothetical protein KAR91_70190 [Candidatus Pacearchaeota archaeon]|nr:hypothetical protein [Candidatus Pacearchaeota archaeon]
MKITLKIGGEEGQNIWELVLLKKGNYRYPPDITRHPIFREVGAGNCLFTVNKGGERRHVISFTNPYIKRLVKILETTKLPLPKDRDWLRDSAGVGVGIELSFESTYHSLNYDKVCFSWGIWERFDPPKEWKALRDVKRIILDLEENI